VLADGTAGALVRGMDAVVATLVMMVSASFVGFGAVAAALANHHNQLVILTMLLSMIAAASRPPDFDL